MVIDCLRAALAACGALEILGAERRADCAVFGGKERPPAMTRRRPLYQYLSLSPGL